MGLFPKWVSEFPNQFWRTITGKDETVAVGDYKTGIQNIFNNIGTGIKDGAKVVSDTAGRLLGGFLPTLVVIAIILITILFLWKKVARA